MSHGEFSDSFFEFYPHYFEGVYGLGGNFGWMGIHLWYLEMLFIFSMIFLPLFWLLKRGWGERIVTGLGNLLAIPGLAIFLIVPATLILNLVDGDSLLGMDIYGSWGILSHAWFFVSGFLIASSERLQKSIQRLRWVWLVGASALTLAVVAPRGLSDVEHTDLMAYLWILTFLGWARQRLNFGTPRLQYANEAVLPFYILHQPILISVGYFVTQWAISDAAKYVIIAAVSFAIIIALYEFLVRRFNILRFLFGMKVLAMPVGIQTKETPLKEAARTM